MPPIPTGVRALATIPVFDYASYAALVLGAAALVAVAGYVAARRWDIERPLAIPLAALLLAGLALIPAPQPAENPSAVTGEVTGRALLTLDGSVDAPIHVTGGTGEATETDGRLVVELVCPDGCEFRIGSVHEPDASVGLGSRTVTLEGGPLVVRDHQTYCRDEPWILNIGGIPCTSTGWASYGAPEGANGTVRLNATGGVAA